MVDDVSLVLLVEDNQDDFEATERSFKKNHFMTAIKWCCSGQDALEYLKKSGRYEKDESVQRPDLILLDLNMPGMDGRTLLKIIKEDPAISTIPVIVLTTSSDEKDVEHCYELGASTYIQKPVSLDGLTKSIKIMKDYWCNVAILPQRKDP